MMRMLSSFDICGCLFLGLFRGLRGFSVFLLLLVLLSPKLALSKETLPDLNDPIYKDYKNKKQMWLCSSLGFPVDVSYDAFRTHYSLEYGFFSQVEPGNPKQTIKDNVSGIFNVAGRSAGVYEFVFTSEINDFCLMDKGQQSVVRVYLVPDLRPFTVLSHLCAGEDNTIDLLNYVPYEVKNFADSMGWSLQFYGTDVVDGHLVKSNLSKVGTRNYTYKYDDSKSKVIGGLESMNKVSAYRCAETAVATVNVKIHSDEFKIEDRDVSFCLESLMSVPHNIPLMRLNLSSLLGAYAEAGEWSLSNTGQAFVSLDKNDAILNLDLIKVQDDKNSILPLSLGFDYKYMDCKGDLNTARLVVKITKELAKLVTDSEKPVCRNRTSGSIDLDTYFGFSVPTTSGEWYFKDPSQGEIYMPTSTVHIDTLKVGSLYDFVYRVHPAVEQLCDLTAQEANFRLRIREAGVLGGVGNICKSSYLDPATRVNLFSYVPGLTDSINNVEWYSCDSNGECSLPIDNTKARDYSLLDGNDLDGNNIDYFQGVRSFLFKYGSECGPVEGKVYLSVIDSLLNKEQSNRKIVLCYTDDWATNVDLNQVFELAGLKKFWTYPTSNQIDLGGRTDIWKPDTNPPVFNARKAFELASAALPSQNEFAFVFEYDPDPKECIVGKLTLTIVVTRDVVKPLE